MKMTPDRLDQLQHPDEVNGEGTGTRVVTVRMQQALHAALKTEAHRYETSLNRLALAKLRIAGEPFDSAVEAVRGGGSS